MKDVVMVISIFVITFILAFWLVTALYIHEIDKVEKENKELKKQ